MRLLVACPNCKRQYDASALPVGKRFRCHCGQVLTVHEPQPHDAAVVCCAHCGAPRSEGALKCEFCGADFTLHERDLDTVCPHCFTRVSHLARFCHFCGQKIQPEMVTGEKSTCVCPVCRGDHVLTSRAFGNISALECNRCAGIWLSAESFRELTERAAQERLDSDDRDPPHLARPAEVEGPPPDGGKRYRPCPVCGDLMVKQNYGRGSGVIVDVCRNHGVWFDADELPRILDWVRAGGLALANAERAAQGDEVTIYRQPFELDSGSLQGLAREYSHDSSMAAALGGLARWLMRQ